MNLVIKIENGEPVNHPILEENLRTLIPDLDIDNLPEGYARFVRKPYPELDNLKMVERTNYVIDPVLSTQINKVWTDEYIIRDLTEEEMLELVDNETKLRNEKMAKDSNAPYPAPEDGNLYVWSSRLNQWIIKPDNFDEVVSAFAEKLAKLDLLSLKPEDLENIDEDKKQQLQQLVDEINTIEGFQGFGI